jgi:predicted nucleic acid-binding protein
MRVVSNSGPLIHLARAAHFDLLRVLFGRVLIPPTVYQEVAVRGKGEDGSHELARSGWIHQRRPRRADLGGAIGRMRERGTWIADDLVTAVLAAAGVR